MRGVEAHVYLHTSLSEVRGWKVGLKCCSNYTALTTLTTQYIHSLMDLLTSVVPSLTPQLQCCRSTAHFPQPHCHRPVNPHPPPPPHPPPSIFCKLTIVACIIVPVVYQSALVHQASFFQFLGPAVNKLNYWDTKSKSWQQQ